MRLLFVVLLGILAGCAAPAPAAAPARPTAAALADKTVALVAERYGEPRAYCTGVWIGQTSILTAAHCVDDGEVTAYLERTDVELPSGTYKTPEAAPKRFAVVVKRDAFADLALLRAISLPAPHDVARVHFGSIAAGTHCATVGHSLGLWYSYSSGEVAAVRFAELGEDRAQLWLQTTTPISPGNSGGGLFDDAGELLGIASSVAVRGANVGFFVPSSTIEAFLQGA